MTKGKNTVHRVEHAVTPEIGEIVRTAAEKRIYGRKRSASERRGDDAKAAQAARNREIERRAALERYAWLRRQISDANARGEAQLLSDLNPAKVAAQAAPFVAPELFAADLVKLGRIGTVAKAMKIPADHPGWAKLASAVSLGEKGLAASEVMRATSVAAPAAKALRTLDDGKATPEEKAEALMTLGLMGSSAGKGPASRSYAMVRRADLAQTLGDMETGGVKVGSAMVLDTSRPGWEIASLGVPRGGFAKDAVNGLLKGEVTFGLSRDFIRVPDEEGFAVVSPGDLDELPRTPETMRLVKEGDVDELARRFAEPGDKWDPRGQSFFKTSVGAGASGKIVVPENANEVLVNPERIPEGWGERLRRGSPDLTQYGEAYVVRPGAPFAFNAQNTPTMVYSRPLFFKGDEGKFRSSVFGRNWDEFGLGDYFDRLARGLMSVGSPMTSVISGGYHNDAYPPNYRNRDMLIDRGWLDEMLQEARNRGVKLVEVRNPYSIGSTLAEPGGLTALNLGEFSDDLISALGFGYKLPGTTKAYKKAVESLGPRPEKWGPERTAYENAVSDLYETIISQPHQTARDALERIRGTRGPKEALKEVQRMFKLSPDDIKMYREFNKVEPMDTPETAREAARGVEFHEDAKGGRTVHAAQDAGKTARRGILVPEKKSHPMVWGYVAPDNKKVFYFPHFEESLRNADYLVHAIDGAPRPGSGDLFQLLTDRTYGAYAPWHFRKFSGERGQTFLNNMTKAFAEAAKTASPTGGVVRVPSFSPRGGTFVFPYSRLITEEIPPGRRGWMEWAGALKGSALDTSGDPYEEYQPRGITLRQMDAKGGRTVQAAEGAGDTAGTPETVVSETPVSEAPAQPSGPRIVINPKVFTDKRDALCVAFNEAFRLVMEANAFEPVSEPTEKQRKFFADTAYADDELQLRRTILARIATLDTSVSDPTDEQLEETAEMLEMVMEVGAPQNEWEQQAVQRLHDVVAKSLESTRANGTAQQPEPPKDEASTQADVGGGITDDEEEEDRITLSNGGYLVASGDKGRYAHYTDDGGYIGDYVGVKGPGEDGKFDESQLKSHEGWVAGDRVDMGKGKYFIKGADEGTGVIYGAFDNSVIDSNVKNFETVKWEGNDSIQSFKYTTSTGANRYEDYRDDGTKEAVVNYAKGWSSNKNNVDGDDVGSTFIYYNDDGTLRNAIHKGPHGTITTFADGTVGHGTQFGETAEDLGAEAKEEFLADSPFDKDGNRIGRMGPGDAPGSEQYTSYEQQRAEDTGTPLDAVNPTKQAEPRDQNPNPTPQTPATPGAEGTSSPNWANGAVVGKNNPEAFGRIEHSWANGQDVSEFRDNPGAFGTKAPGTRGVATPKSVEMPKLNWQGLASHTDARGRYFDNDGRIIKRRQAERLERKRRKELEQEGII